MLIQLPVAPGSPNKNEFDSDNSPTLPRRQKKILKQIASFLNPVNPGTWFNNLRDIRITLEEFQVQQDEDI